MNVKEAIEIIKEYIGSSYRIAITKDFIEYYGFFVKERNSNNVGRTLICVDKNTKEIFDMDISENKPGCPSYMEARTIEI